LSRHSALRAAVAARGNAVREGRKVFKQVLDVFSNCRDTSQDAFISVSESVGAFVYLAPRLVTDVTFCTIERGEFSINGKTTDSPFDVEGVTGSQPGEYTSLAENIRFMSHPHRYCQVHITSD